MKAVNGVRGEVSARLAGEDRRLCLTLGALAEIETGLGVRGAEAVAERMRRLSAKDLTVVLAALLRGGGEDELAERLASASVSPVEAAEAVARAFAAAGG
ncbi:GTA-gp10 family protein [Brevundimonas balnearis]|uniref:GTA-gp10 family protein n=1 Tax=Brevundimonas balnearis TaxID=1572858 RepID=A0ABV6R5I1_9CAUL